MPLKGVQFVGLNLGKWALGKNCDSRATSFFNRRRAMTTQLLYTIDQAADALAISRASMYRLISGKQIVTITIGRCRRVSLQALEGFIQAKTKSEYASW
jgi:excisionase family DNA binding protein